MVYRCRVDLDWTAPNDTEDDDYDFSEPDELTHASAVTVHRAVASTHPCVLSRSPPLVDDAATILLYTAVTRAKKLVVLVGSTKAIGLAVRVTGAGRRHTALNHPPRRAFAPAGHHGSSGHEPSPATDPIAVPRSPLHRRIAP